MTRPSETCRPTRSVWVVVSLLVISAGCQHGDVFQASTLPSQYVARPLRTPQSLNLSRLAAVAESLEVIQPEDVLSVTIAAGVEQHEPTTWEQRVTPEGLIHIPLIGSVQVRGMKLTEAEGAISQAAVQRDVYRSPHVAVAFQSRKSNRVTIVGAVAVPGIKSLPAASSSLVDAVVAAGGLTKEASSMVEVSYPQTPAADLTMSDGMQDVVPASYAASDQSSSTRQRLRLDLHELEAAGGRSPQLDDGAVVTVVRRQPPQITLLGLVRKPGQYEFPPDGDLHLLDAVALGGGPTMEIANKAHIIRIPSEGMQPIVIRASLREAKRQGPANLRLAPGDIVSLEETPLTFTVGMLRNFVGLGFTSPLPGL